LESASANLSSDRYSLFKPYLSASETMPEVGHLEDQASGGKRRFRRHSIFPGGR